MIPKIIHQTWKTKENLPVDFEKYSSTWKNLHHDWDYRLYDDNDCLLIVKKYFPEFLHLSCIIVFLGHIFPIWLKFRGGK